MLGGIYTREKCPLCGGKMRDDGRSGVTCPAHPKQRAGKLFVRFGRGGFHNCGSYEEAVRLLTGLRFKKDEGSYDRRDYQRGNPLGLGNLVEKYLEHKQREITRGYFVSLRPLMLRVVGKFGAETNVKAIRYGELEDFKFELLDGGELKSKTVHNLFSHLSDFYGWLVRREELDAGQVPRLPTVSYNMGWRKTISRETQERVLDEIWRLCEQKTPRAWLAVRLLMSYVSLRPGELLGVLEEDVDLEQGIMWIREHKTRRHTQAPKSIPLLEEDVEFIRGLPKGFPLLPFFRRDAGGGGRHKNTAFGKHYLYDLWKKACKAAGVEGVDLYGGTRHSTCRFLREAGKTPEEVRRLTDHSTNKAFDRYLALDSEEKREGARFTRLHQGSQGNQGNKSGLPEKKNPLQSG